MASDAKSAAAFRTIGEVAQATGIAPHILRYWEGRFPQLRPVTRAGNRRYYRPSDVLLIERIDRLLNQEGYSVKGVQQLLAAERPARLRAAEPHPAPPPSEVPPLPPATDSTTLAELRVIRDWLAAALSEA